MDATDDPLIGTAIVAYYEKLASNTPDLEDDYDPVSATTSEAIIVTSPYNSLKVNKISAGVDTTVATGQFKITTSGGFITNLVFDQAFTNYLEGFAALIGSKVYNLKIINKSKNHSYITTLTSFTYTTGANKYYNVAVDNIIASAGFSVNDICEMEISVSDKIIDGGTP
jgi:hypothetical protein